MLYDEHTMTEYSEQTECGKKSITRRKSKKAREYRHCDTQIFFREKNELCSDATKIFQ